MRLGEVIYLSELVSNLILDQSILTYQRLTNVIAKLTNGVEAELQKRMDELDNRARETFDNLGQLSPRIKELKDDLGRVESYLSRDLEGVMRKSSKAIRGGMEDAQNLQQLLRVLLTTALDGNTELAAAHEKSIQQVSVRASNDIGTLAAVVAGAAASTVSLQQQLVSNLMLSFFTVPRSLC